MHYCDRMLRYWNNRQIGTDEVRREAIFRQIDVRGPDECWPWLGGRLTPSLKKRYGRTQFRGTRWLVHRAVYTLEVGEIPDGFTVDHTCFIEDCCNPAHLEAVTRRENYDRALPRRKARAAARTHCVHGHELTPGNAAPRPDGGKSCRRCSADSQRRYRERQKSLT